MALNQSLNSSAKLFIYGQNLLTPMGVLAPGSAHTVYCPLVINMMHGGPGLYQLLRG